MLIVLTQLVRFSAHVGMGTPAVGSIALTLMSASPRLPVISMLIAITMMAHSLARVSKDTLAQVSSVKMTTSVQPSTGMTATAMLDVQTPLEVTCVSVIPASLAMGSNVKKSTNARVNIHVISMLSAPTR